MRSIRCIAIVVSNLVLFVVYLATASTVLGVKSDPAPLWCEADTLAPKEVDIAMEQAKIHAFAAGFAVLYGVPYDLVWEFAGSRKFDAPVYATRLAQMNTELAAYMARQSEAFMLAPVVELNANSFGAQQLEIRRLLEGIGTKIVEIVSVTRTAQAEMKKYLQAELEERACIDALLQAFSEATKQLNSEEDKRARAEVQAGANTRKEIISVIHKSISAYVSGFSQCAEVLFELDAKYTLAHAHVAVKVEESSMATARDNQPQSTAVRIVPKDAENRLRQCEAGLREREQEIHGTLRQYGVDAALRDVKFERDASGMETFNLYAQSIEKIRAHADALGLALRHLLIVRWASFANQNAICLVRPLQVETRSIEGMRRISLPVGTRISRIAKIDPSPPTFYVIAQGFAGQDAIRITLPELREAVEIRTPSSKEIVASPLAKDC